MPTEIQFSLFMYLSKTTRATNLEFDGTEILIRKCLKYRALCTRFEINSSNSHKMPIKTIIKNYNRFLM